MKKCRIFVVILLAGPIAKIIENPRTIAALGLQVEHPDNLDISAQKEIGKAIFFGCKFGFPASIQIYAFDFI